VTVDRRGFLKLSGAGWVTTRLGLFGCGDQATVPPDAVVDMGNLPVPPLLEGELVGGVRSFTLDVQTGSVEWVAGAPTATYGVNGPVLGPTLALRRGERVRLEVTNSLSETTTLHWHGMQVPARADGGPYQTIAPGATWVAEFDVDQRATTTWYHPHQMHATGRQVYMGIAGVIRVVDPAEAFPLPSTYGVDDIPLVIQDRRLFADGTHPYSDGGTPTMHDHMSGMRGPIMLVNGAITPRAVVPRGLVRFRLLNGSNARIYNLGLSDNRTFKLIATDGGLLDAPVATTRVLLAPGERAEIVVDFGADAAGTAVQLVSYSSEVFSSLYIGMMGANMTDALDKGTFDVMTFETGAMPAPQTSVPATFEPIVRIAAGDAVRTRTLTFSMAQGAWLINGAEMTSLDNVPAAIDFQVRSGEIEIWEVTNTTFMAHPLHLHHKHFQVLSIDGQPPPPALAGWKDTVTIRPSETVRIIIPFAGAGDSQFPYLFHCHVLEHEDMGMMGRFFLLDPA